MLGFKDSKNHSKQRSRAACMAQWAKHLPSAWVTNPGSWDPAPHRAPCSLKKASPKPPTARGTDQGPSCRPLTSRSLLPRCHAAQDHSCPRLSVAGESSQFPSGEAQCFANGLFWLRNSLTALARPSSEYIAT